MRFVLASNNQKKLSELRVILGAQGHEVLSLGDCGVCSDPEETGSTFEENALIKARNACAAACLPAVADDSGLEVDALGGAPGVHSARYCPGSDQDRIDLLLKNMESVPDDQRGARFVSAVACVFPDGRELVARGECPGVILRQMQGDGGFGYDPIFYVPQEKMTFAQLPPDRKNEISHRGRALFAFAARLKEMKDVADAGSACCEAVCPTEKRK